MAGETYDLKVSFEIGRGPKQRDVVVYANERDGRKGACYYCGKPGHQVKLEIIEIVVDQETLDAQKELGLSRFIERKFRRLMLDGRRICQNNTFITCDARLSNDRAQGKMMVV